MRFASTSNRWSSVSLLALAAFALACSSKSSSSQSSAPVASSDLAARFAQSFCSSIQSCCAASGYSTATCESSLQATLDASVATMVADPKVTYDAAAAARFIDAYSAIAAACTDKSLSTAATVQLDDVFKGTVALGGSCGSTQDCVQKEGNYVTCDTGVCTLGASNSATAAHALLGQACIGTCTNFGTSGNCSSDPSVAWSSTPTGGYCWTSDGVYCTGGTCATVPTIGQACGGDSFCEIAGHCDNSVCVAATATGQCAGSNACVSTSYCDAANWMCKPKKANGAACNSDEECAGGQCYQNLCRNWTAATAAWCAGLLDG
jgi:hypothetical protein